MPRQPRIPSYRLHKPSGRAVVTISGKDIYLGVYESPESQVAYKKEIAEWLANHQLEIGPASPTRTVNEILLAYLRHAQQYYRKHGKPTKQLARIQAALRPVRELYGTSLAAEFGPLALKAVRQVMIDGGWSRNYVNACVGCIKRLWKWAASEELVTSEIFQRINTVEGLRKGRSKAKETKPIRPVPWSDVKLALPHVSRAVRAMIKLQFLTGMRPGEVVILRACDINQDKPIWEYRPSIYKTEHIDQERVIYLGPKAQAIIQKFLRPDPAAYLFSPKEARHLRKRRVNDHYSVDTYLQAVQYGCAQAKMTVFTPLQLRHTAATRIRKRHGIEVARIILGHSTAFTTEIYAEADRGKAMKAMGKMG